MVARKPRIVIIGAGMAGLTAANKLYKATRLEELFELCVVEGGTRIGGRIGTSDFGGDRIEMGATWIHGIGGSPIHQIAQEIHALDSEQPWECMDGFPDEDPVTIAEGGLRIDSPVVEPISKLYRKMMDFAQGKLTEASKSYDEVDYYRIATKALENCKRRGYFGDLGVGFFLRQALDVYWAQADEREDDNSSGNWSTKLLQEAICAMNENTERTYTSAGDLLKLDFNAESEYRQFPGEEVTIPKGYLSIIESLASVLPAGAIQLGRKVRKIEWKPQGLRSSEVENGCDSSRPVKLHFEDGLTMFADHVIVTVSLGVLKTGIQEGSGLFDPPLPSFKTEAISRLGFGVVNKLFLELDPIHDQESETCEKLPFLQMVFHRSDSELRNRKIPWWMRRTASLYPIYRNSSVLLSWFAGEEALELESLRDDEIINGVTRTISSFLSDSQSGGLVNHQGCSNGNVNPVESSRALGKKSKLRNVLRSRWGTDPLFMGSYSYVAVGSSGNDFDSMAEPLPKSSGGCVYVASPPLQILFAGEATHKTHYSTTHGAYLSGVREANRLLQHYHSGGFSEV
ncbi:PREDICTED: probable polyamine oxidase 5 [Nelumbo nucifera]|uniref:Amine oxidase domain-containing protein n=2 Tax=Nelumbo nucifera TaxID=4432 RepID=A0A823A101_NELNU|nr:PREDICTED: probable polyamine oxidase 5 [Nelumbo nucifera]DAD48989.1 TPA_asm: hypothetical protein HUJ06_018926 [Nelumbo nucifera]